MFLVYSILRNFFPLKCRLRIRLPSSLQVHKPTSIYLVTFFYLTIPTLSHFFVLQESLCERPIHPSSRKRPCHVTHKLATLIMNPSIYVSCIIHQLTFPYLVEFIEHGCGIAFISIFLFPKTCSPATAFSKMTHPLPQPAKLTFHILRLFHQCRCGSPSYLSFCSPYLQSCILHSSYFTFHSSLRTSILNHFSCFLTSYHHS
jgi:hypothetical protein